VVSCIKVIPILFDFLLDYNNGFKAFNAVNTSRAARSLYWAMFINVVLTPSISDMGIINPLVGHHFQRRFLTF
tara:strand:+ start:213 stop:431 length:219 start_codon:yes stop_codon:yes gene_type:complete